MLMRATRSFTTTYDGERVEIIAGCTHVARDHELVRRFPDSFDDNDVRIASSDRAVEEFAERYPAAQASNGNGHRSRSLGPDEEAGIIAHQGAVRRARLEQLARRERERPSRQSSEDRFWVDVEAQLRDPREERQIEEHNSTLDMLERMERSRLDREREDVAGWLDES